MSGCVNYSRRFYDETLKSPETASPLVFPETVFNAPASHIAALIGTRAINYTLVGDPGTFLQGLALAADWLLADKVDGVVVIGAEEMDWLTADAFRLFSRGMVTSEGAGALYLKREVESDGAVALIAITDPQIFVKTQSRAVAANRMRNQVPTSALPTILFDSQQNLAALDAAESAAWRDWSGERVSIKELLGEGLMAAAAWQCVLATQALKQKRFQVANVSVVGCNEQAIGAQFQRVG